MTILDDVKQRCREYDMARPRSTQDEVGWSEVGGCRSYLGFRLAGEWATDDPDTWAALRGTIIHLFIESLMTAEGEHVEIETRYRDILGHGDILRTATGIWDIKTTKLVNARMWQSNEKALFAKRVQVHGYAAGLVAAGQVPEDCTVGLIVIPVDGTYDDWWLFEEPFNRAFADEGADGLEQVKRMTADGVTLPKDMPYSWCSEWCQFFKLCRDDDDPYADAEITDPELVWLIDDYGLANADASAAGKRKKEIAPLIRGLRGVAGDWRISLSKPGQPKKVLDEEWIRADYAARGLDVPEITVPGDAPKLYVRQVRKP